MNPTIKVLFLAVLLGFVFSPFAHARARVNEPGGGGGVPHATAASSSSNSQPTVVTPNSAGQCPSGYRATTCVKI